MFAKTLSISACLALTSLVAAEEGFLDATTESAILQQIQDKRDNPEAWKTPLFQKLASSPEYNDELKNELIIPKVGSHLLWSDEQALIQDIAREFPGIVKLTSIGKSFEGRDIDMLTLAVGSKSAEETAARSSMLFTGAHHPREAVSVQMPFYILFKALHGLIHGDDFWTQQLRTNTFHFIPVVNIDGYHQIEQVVNENGGDWETELALQRKNRNNTWSEAFKTCDNDASNGIDLNRNYGFAHGTGGTKDDICSEGFAGPYPFSEPETRAMRDFVLTNMDSLKFVYNFHSFVNMYITPFNAIQTDIMPEAFPIQDGIYKDIVSNSDMPAEIKIGRAYATINYLASGEASDWILAATGIPAVSPELGDANKEETFKFTLDTPELVFEVLDAHYPYVETTIGMLNAQVVYSVANETKYDYLEPESSNELFFDFTLQNRGLTSMEEGAVIKMGVSSSDFKITRVIKDYSDRGYGSVEETDEGVKFSPIFARDNVVWTVGIEYTGDEIEVPAFDFELTRVSGDTAIPDYASMSVKPRKSNNQMMEQYLPLSLAQLNDNVELWGSMYALCGGILIAASINFAVHKRRQNKTNVLISDAVPTVDPQTLSMML